MAINSRRAGYPGRSPDIQSIRDVPPRRIETRFEFLPKTLIAFPPEYFPPPGAVEFDLYDSRTMAALSVQTPTELTVNVGPGYRGVIRWFGNFGTSTDLRWQIRLNEGTIPGYPSIRTVLGAIESPTPLYVIVSGPVKIDVRLENTSAAVQEIQTRLKGWYWPLVSERKLVAHVVLEKGGAIT